MTASQGNTGALHALRYFFGVMDLRLAMKFPQTATSPRAVSEQAGLRERALEEKVPQCWCLSCATLPPLHLPALPQRSTGRL